MTIPLTRRAWSAGIQINFRGRPTDLPTKKHRRRQRFLDDEFVAAVRKAAREEWGRDSSPREWRTRWRPFQSVCQGEMPCSVVVSNESRFRKLAERIGYEGPILGEVAK